MLIKKQPGAQHLASVMTSPARAAENAPAEASADKPMMRHGGGMGHLMVNPQMMQMRMQHMLDYGTTHEKHRNAGAATRRTGTVGVGACAAGAGF